MFSTRAMSAAHSMPGRQSSRRLQLEQVTSNFACIGILRWTAFSAMTAGMAWLPLMREIGGALGDHIAHAFEIAGFVEEAAGSQPLGLAPVGLRGKVGQHVERDARGLAVHLDEYVEAGPLRQLQELGRAHV